MMNLFKNYCLSIYLSIFYLTNIADTHGSILKNFFSYITVKERYEVSMVCYFANFCNVTLKIVVPALFIISSCWPQQSLPHYNKRVPIMKLTSPAFSEGASIPRKYTCQGDDISPELTWSNVPQNTKSFALICDDPDASGGTWVHWVIFNIPPSVTKIPEGEKPVGIEGITNFGKTGYGGPCPPSGTHRYFFKLYALDTELSLKRGATAQDVEHAMEGHKLATAQLMGVYEKRNVKK